jgi:hypothetical protein
MTDVLDVTLRARAYYGTGTKCIGVAERKTEGDETPTTWTGTVLIKEVDRVLISQSRFTPNQLLTMQLHSSEQSRGASLEKSMADCKIGDVFQEPLIHRWARRVRRCTTFKRSIKITRKATWRNSLYKHLALL